MRVPPLLHLDEWDAALFTVTLVLAGGASAFAGASPALGAKVAMGAAASALAARRALDPRVRDRERGPAPPPMTLLGLLLMALGVSGLLVTVVALLLAFLMVAEGSPDDAPLPWTFKVALSAFPVVSATMSVALIRLARRQRRRRA